MEALGYHSGACTRTGLFARRGFVLERIRPGRPGCRKCASCRTGRVSRSAALACRYHNTWVRPDGRRHDERRIEVITKGLQSSQLAIELLTQRWCRHLHLPFAQRRLG